jgi:RNA polymerase sigma-70 factor, ECF subfamily
MNSRPAEALPVRTIPAMDDDQLLLERSRAGDVAAFADLVRRYEHRVRAILFRLLDDERDVEEATQDAFVQAWKNLERFRGDAAVFTWLYRIATNEALARLRKKRLATTELENLPEGVAATDESDEPQELTESSELEAFLAARIRELEPEYRAPLVLRDVVGLSNQEVADVLELSLAATKSRIHRARMQIREAFVEWDSGRPARS